MQGIDNVRRSKLFQSTCQLSPAEVNVNRKINASDYSWSLQPRFPQFILVKLPANPLLKHIILKFRKWQHFKIKVGTQFMDRCVISYIFVVYYALSVCTYAT